MSLCSCLGKSHTDPIVATLEQVVQVLNSQPNTESCAKADMTAVIYTTDSLPAVTSKQKNAKSSTDFLTMQILFSCIPYC